MDLKCVEVFGIPGALLVGYIRNDCIEWMTGSNKYVSVPEQIKWWSERQNGVSAYLFYPDVSDWQNGPIGFGTVTVRDDYQYAKGNTSWVSGGLIATHRGAGYGYYLFKRLVKMCLSDIYLDVWAANVPAVKTYEKLGFRPVGQRISARGSFAKEYILTMKKDYDPSF
jgi:RimJ/RimL family protein N-acetyltransferase